MVTRKLSAALGVCVLAASLLGGCGGGPSAINGRDDNVFFPSLRADFTPTRSGDQAPDQSDIALEAGISHAAGSGQQHLDTGYIALGSFFRSPVDIRQDYDLTAMDALARFRVPPRELVFAEFLGGFRFTDLDLRLRSDSASGRREIRGIALAAGAGAGVRVTDSLLLDLRFLIDLAGNGGRLNSRDLELSWWITKQAALTGGFRRWRYTAGRRRIGHQPAGLDGIHGRPCFRVLRRCPRLPIPADRLHRLALISIPLIDKMQEHHA